MRLDRRCDAFTRRLDRMDPDVEADPHLQECPVCAVEMRLAHRTREILAGGRGIAGSEARPSFAARVAYIASADRREEANAGLSERSLFFPALSVTAVLTVLALTFQEVMPSIIGRFHLHLMSRPIAIGLRGDILAMAVPILALTAVGALVGVRLARRSA